MTNLAKIRITIIMVIASIVMLLVAVFLEPADLNPQFPGSVRFTLFFTVLGISAASMVLLGYILYFTNSVKIKKLNKVTKHYLLYLFGIALGAMLLGNSGTSHSYNDLKTMQYTLVCFIVLPYWFACLYLFYKHTKEEN